MSITINIPIIKLKNEEKNEEENDIEENITVPIPKIINFEKNQIKIQEFLNEGGFAMVFLGEDINTNKKYAIKELVSHGKETFTKICQEIVFMKNLESNQHILKIHDQKVVLTPGNVFFKLNRKFKNQKEHLTIFLLLELGTGTQILFN
jgi:serine/threonine protein kinase